MKVAANLARQSLRPLQRLSGDPFPRADSRIASRRRPLGAQGLEVYQSAITHCSCHRYRCVQAIQLAMQFSTAWPTHRVVSVDSQLTETYHMSSSDGEFWSNAELPHNAMTKEMLRPE